MSVAAQVEYLSVTQAAKKAKMTGGRVRQLLIAGELAGFKVGNSWAIPAHEVNRLRKNRSKMGRPRSGDHPKKNGKST